MNLAYLTLLYKQLRVYLKGDQVELFFRRLTWILLSPFFVFEFALSLIVAELFILVGLIFGANLVELIDAFDFPEWPKAETDDDCDLNIDGPTLEDSEFDLEEYLCEYIAEIQDDEQADTIRRVKEAAEADDEDVNQLGWSDLAEAIDTLNKSYRTLAHWTRVAAASMHDTYTHPVYGSFLLIDGERVYIERYTQDDALTPGYLYYVVETRDGHYKVFTTDSYEVAESTLIDLYRRERDETREEERELAQERLVRKFFGTYYPKSLERREY